MFKFVCLCLAALLLAGCAGNSIRHLPPSEPMETNVVHAFPVPAAPVIVQPKPKPIPAVAYPLPVVPKSVPIATWTPLVNWTDNHHLPDPRRLTGLPVDAYSLTSSNGVMVLEIGSREATWNGVQISLGFAPQIIDGEVSLNGLDFQKNLEPLLCDPPLEFTQHQVIVIDPGHGGSNVGTHSVLDGRFEKEFTLDLAKRLKPLLEAEGWLVFLTRTSDVYVTNDNRVIFANTRRADLFISLHFNSGAPDTKQAGLETYCLTPTGMPSTVTRNYADPWNESLPNNHFDAQNLQLAVRVHSALLRATGMNDRGVRRARFIEVLRGQNHPAILVEAGYLSNPAEATRIENGDYRQTLAETLAAALAPAKTDEDGK